MREKECNFCEWTGPINSYPFHLAEECPETTPSADETSDDAPEVATDGGEPTTEVGDRVVDTDDRDGDELVVVETHRHTRADEFAIDDLDGATVAEVNETYAPSVPVLEAVYLPEVEAAEIDPTDVGKIRWAVDLGAVNAYAFPWNRLARVDEEDTDPVATRGRAAASRGGDA